MIIPQTTFNNNDKAAHAVYDLLPGLSSSVTRYSLRPHNFYLPEFTHWWLIPSTDWPAYRYSKLSIHRWPQQEEPQYMYLGYYVEKGLGPSLTGMTEVNSRQIMHSDWFWYEFLNHVQKGNIQLALREVFNRSECSPIVYADLYYFNRAPLSDKERHVPDDWVEFSFQPDSLSLQPERVAINELAECNGYTDLQNLIKRLVEIKGSEYYWIDIFLGVRAQYGTATTDGWDAMNIWRKALEPWAPWIG